MESNIGARALEFREGVEHCGIESIMQLDCFVISTGYQHSAIRGKPHTPHLKKGKQEVFNLDLSQEGKKIAFNQAESENGK